jgi:4-hydroxy-tetrahydrodipicolinate synthase
MHRIQGVFSAALTPINEDYTINSHLFYTHCKWLLNQEVDGLGVFGTTGEANAFNVEEKIKAIEYLINSKIPSNKLIPGTGQCSISDTVRFTKKCATLKIRTVLVLPAFFYKGVSDEGVIEYYKRVIEEVGDNNLHYILYHIPQTSGVRITFDVIDKLTKLYPNNVVGMKDSSGDLDNMLKITKFFDGFSLFSGSDSLALKVVKHGGAGAITATSNISGRLLSFIINNYKAEFSIDNFQELQKLQEKIRQTLFTHEPISALKAFMAVKYKKIDWNRVNPPLKKIDNPENHKTVISLMELIKKMDELIPTT